MILGVIIGLVLGGAGAWVAYQGGRRAGTARSVETVNRRWLETIRRIEATNETVASTVARCHARDVEMFSEALAAARDQITILKAKLDATAVPGERN